MGFTDFLTKGGLAGLAGPMIMKLPLPKMASQLVPKGAAGQAVGAMGGIAPMMGMSSPGSMLAGFGMAQGPVGFKLSGLSG